MIHIIIINDNLIIPFPSIPIHSLRSAPVRNSVSFSMFLSTFVDGAGPPVMSCPLTSQTKSRQWRSAPTTEPGGKLFEDLEGNYTALLPSGKLT